MSTEILMPALSPTMEEGKLSKWLVKEGDTVKTTGKVVEVPVGQALLGRVVNPLGQPLDDKGPIKTTKSRPVERIAPGVIVRKSVDDFDFHRIATELHLKRLLVICHASLVI